MSEKIKATLFRSLPVIVFSTLIATFFIYAWTEPTQSPPQGNVPAPINVGAGTQYKSGALGIGGVFRGYSNAIFDGNVGIGTTAPNRKLELVSDVSGLSFEAGTGSPNSGVIRFGDNTGWKLHFGRSRNSVGGALNSGTAGVLMTIQDNGNVGIGTTAPSYKLDVVGAIRLQPSSAPTGANGVIYYDSSTNKFRCYQNGAWVDCIASGGLGGSGTTNYVAKFTGSTTLGNSQIFDNGTSVGIGTTNPSTSYKLDVNGGVRATAFYYTSDLALKTNIKPLENSLAKILQLQGVSFNWKDSGEPSIGLIAQEVEKIFPELVSGNEGSKTVDYGKLVPVLIEAIKEQQNEIEKLKLEIEALKSK